MVEHPSYWSAAAPHEKGEVESPSFELCPIRGLGRHLFLARRMCLTPIRFCRKSLQIKAIEVRKHPESPSTCRSHRGQICVRVWVRLHHAEYSRRQPCIQRKLSGLAVSYPSQQERSVLRR